MILTRTNGSKEKNRELERLSHGIQELNAKAGDYTTGGPRIAHCAETGWCWEN